MLVLTFQVGSYHLALDVGQVHEIVPCVRLQSVACGPDWLAGVFIYRGKTVPVVELHRVLEQGKCPIHLSTRIILVHRSVDGQDGLLGLLAAKVADVKELPLPAVAPNRLATTGGPELGPILVDGREVIHLVELERLLPEIANEPLALVAKEPAT
jgi:chemotaxis-related protein WspB